MNQKKKETLNNKATKIQKKAFSLFSHLDMNHFKIINVGDPTDLNDAVNLKYLDNYVRIDDPFSGYLPLSGGEMKGSIDMNYNSITNVTTPDKPQNDYAVNVDYLEKSLKPFEDYIQELETKLKRLERDKELLLRDLGLLRNSEPKFLSLNGGVMKGSINMEEHSIINLKTPTDEDDLHAVNVEYILNSLEPFKKQIEKIDEKYEVIENIILLHLEKFSLFLKKAGGVMAGAIDMKENKIINVGDPTEPSDAINLHYAKNNFLLSSGENLKSDLDLNNNSIVNVKTPEDTDLNHAANVEYVTQALKKSITSDYLFYYSDYSTANNNIWLKELNYVWSYPKNNTFSDEAFKTFEIIGSELYIRSEGVYLISWSSLFSFPVTLDSYLTYRCSRETVTLSFNKIINSTNLSHQCLFNVEKICDCNSHFLTLSISENAFLKSNDWQVIKIG